MAWNDALFNSYGSRRGNDRVMTRGTFANIRVRNELAPGTEGGWTTDFTDGEVKSIYEASLNYHEAGIPLVVLAGKDYGMGSSRDWAAKGTYLLRGAGGDRRVVRADPPVQSDRDGSAPAHVPGRPERHQPGLGRHGDFRGRRRRLRRSPVRTSSCGATRSDGTVAEFTTTCRIDTPVEVDYYRNGGILHTVLKRMAAG